MNSLSIETGGAPREGAVHDLFRGRVRRTPDTLALEDGASRWTYGELDHLADEVAVTLRGRVGRGDVVGVCLDHSAALIATALAVARLGAVYLPFGQESGPRRLHAATRTLRIPCLVGDRTAVHAPAAEIVPLAVPTDGRGTAGQVVAAMTEPPPEATSTPPGTHYAVLTSGSTGRPKAVAVGTASLGALLHWYRDLMELAPGARHSLLMGVPFDAHVMEMWAALTSGAALSVAPREVRWDPRALTDWWRDAAITASFLPTPMAEPVLDRPWPDGLVLRHLGIGGDRLRRWPGPDVTAHVYNAYGPAEATVVTTAYPIPPGTTREAKGVPPIGRPIPGATVVVADAAGRAVPRGEPGELRIGGRCLALGYVDDQLTARRFVAAPDAGDRFYRTGDRVVMRTDGVLEFLGRLDDQVKIDGVRIEPAEIETAFEQEPSIRRAAVVAPRDEAGTIRLAAFVQAVPGEVVPSASLLRANARDWLPAQALPVSITAVDTFPLTANGKVDKAALLAAHAVPGDAVGVGGVSPVEQVVLRLCREFLGSPDIGLDDNFLAAGGNSVAGARLLAALEQRYGVRLRASRLLRQPDLRHVATLVEERAAAGEALP
ncbi:non-ribosomal peptide synthetase [Streptomyces sp. WMMC500]|uniref:non-ribosomal peptide synthetase n=1 Tax=Streptomyces sp. WMMC500 TaxID=3015154 RepID=UPI00248CD10D|nr:non-ribosomal peptide synthetase [Streptomyces sp. WMMC500]WBB62058.1 non-ribosomal peptide synthetase [Streptomyces sp. WMMC500]